MRLTQPKHEPVIFDARGNAMHARPVRLAHGDYKAAKDDRFRTLYGGTNAERPQDATELLPFTDRIRIISYLRLAAVNNPTVAALIMRYALSVGSPTVHFNTLDGDTNDARERMVERRLGKVVHGSGWSWHFLHKVISAEEMIAGECFTVELENGKIQIVPAELCGSPAVKEANEIDGILYDADDAPVAYRFGVRIRHGNTSYSSTRISYEEKDGARFVPAEFVTHHGTPSRAEERRFSPRLAPVVGLIQHLDDIINAKVTKVKGHAAMMLFLTKNIDPALFAESSALNASLESAGSTRDDILAGIAASSQYQEIRNGSVMYGAPGEDAKLLESVSNAQDFKEFVLCLLDQICAPLGMFPEEVFIGYRNSSYSSARADRIRLGDTLRDIRKAREAFCDRVVSRVLGVMEIDSIESQVPGDSVTDVTYNWPVIREIDEQKHVSGQAISLANGSKSRAMVCAENGTFADVVQGQIVREAAQAARMVKAYSTHLHPTREQIAAIAVTQAEILAHMPNATAASEALNAIALMQDAEARAEQTAAQTASATVSA